MNNIIIFTGKSGSGKDSAKVYSIENYDVNFVISSTTRPIRSNEQDGVDYNYVTEESFMDSIHANEFLEYRKYFTELGIWYYGTPYKAFNTENSYAVIKDLQGAIELKNQLSNKFSVKIVYISRPDALRKYGAILRDKNFNEAEWNRRLIQDEIDFNDNVVSNNCDYFINNSMEESEFHSNIDNIMTTLGIKSRKEPI